MKAVILTICLLLCVDFAEAKPKHRKKGRKAAVTKHRRPGLARIVRSAPCPVCVPPPTCPDVIQVITADDVDAEANLETTFQRQFAQWLAQHPEANKTPELAAVVRDISVRWYRRGREDAKRK